jgi:hypothetical protein
MNLSKTEHASQQCRCAKWFFDSAAHKMPELLETFHVTSVGKMSNRTLYHFDHEKRCTPNEKLISLLLDQVATF